MRKFINFLPIFLIFCCGNSFAQSDREKSLILLTQQASDEKSRITTLNNLAEYYYRSQFIRKGDSISNIQIRLAELSDDKELLLKTYFDNSAANLVEWTSKQDFERVTAFIQKGIEHAKKINDFNYIVSGYSRLSAVMRRRGKYNEALTAGMFALNTMQQASDSAKAVAYIEVGNCYVAKKDFTIAATNYNNAYEIAVKTNNPYLKSDINRCLAKLNSLLDEDGKVKDYLLESIKLDKKSKYGEGLVKNYLEMGKLTGEEFYLNEAISIADSLHIDGYTFKAKDILLAIYLNEKDNSKALGFLDSQPELRDYYMRDGIENYYYERGTIHLWTDKPDSALMYFTMTESYMLRNFDVKVASNVYLDIGDCYYAKKDIPRAIEYYLKALAYFEKEGEFNSMVTNSETLSSFYKESGNFEKAFYYKELAAHIEDSLSHFTKNTEVALLNVERIKKQDVEELRQAETATTRRRNLQYMSITIAICLVFVGILVLGMFPISRFAIRLLGYFFFISVFEFIILVLDNNILHTITHGEPLTLWLIKIGLIGLLVPIQHFLEHGITKFLESRQLLKARKKFSFKNFWPRKKTRRHNIKTDIKEIENDTAVL